MIRLTEIFNFADSSTYGKLKPQLGQVVSNPYARAFAPQVKEGEDTDYEVSMSQKQLDDIIKSATELKSKMGNAEFNVAAWIQDHISKSQNYINQANYGFDKNESVSERIIKEAKDVKFDFAQASGIEFIVSSPMNNIVLLPKSMKDREKIDIVLKQLGNGGEEDLLSLIQIRLEKKLGISVIPNKRYSGAGYAFDIDTDKLFNKL
jgi:hypothetical protein